MHMCVCVCVIELTVLLPFKESGKLYNIITCQECICVMECEIKVYGHCHQPPTRSHFQIYEPTPPRKGHSISNPEASSSDYQATFLCVQALPVSTHRQSLKLGVTQPQSKGLEGQALSLEGLSISLGKDKILHILVIS